MIIQIINWILGNQPGGKHMLLSDLLQVIAGGEIIEVHDILNHLSYDPHAEIMPKEWDCYVVHSVYSVWDNDIKESSIMIEVVEVKDVKKNR